MKFITTLEAHPGTDIQQEVIDLCLTTSTSRSSRVIDVDEDWLTAFQAGMALRE